MAAWLAVFANASWWVTRTVFDTDQFVSTAESTMRQPEVQQALSVRIADQIIVQGDLQARLAQRLPTGLEALAGPLTEAERSILQRAALTLLQSPRFQALVDRSLRLAHEHIVNVLEDDGTALRIQGTRIVLDLREVLQNVQQDLESRGQGALLLQVTLPPDAGQIVLINHAGGLRAASLLAQHRQALVLSLLAASVAAAAASVVVAVDRRGAIRRAGIALTIAGAVSIVALAISRYPIVSFARDKTAARAAFDEFTWLLRAQSLGMIVGGLIIAGLAVLAGDSHVARALRSSRKSAPGEDAVAELRAARGALVIGGVLVTALVVLAWPEPSGRVYAAAFALIAFFIAALIALSSETNWAKSFRAGIGRFWRDRPAPPSDAGPVRTWVVREDRELQLLGLVLAGLVLLFLPGLTPGLFTLIFVAAIAWIGGIEWLGAAG
ncbi:MAG TPA: hypothetical protein VFY79_13405 [Dehalococcoidia bacterium]|nr:hypothetical protein [Dehalococcoidia bacterium]